MTLQRDRQNRVLSRLVERKTKRLPHPRPARVEGRHRDGTARLAHLDGVCEVRGEISGTRAGQVVTSSAAVIRSRGTSGGAAAGGVAGSAAGSAGSGVEISTATAAEAWVEGLDVGEICAGEEITVTVLGRGFSAATRFDFLLEDGKTINPDVEILATRFLDPERIELDLRVDPAAMVRYDLDEELLRLPLAYGEEGA